MTSSVVLAPVSLDDFEDIYRIVNANADYNALENGSPYRSREEVREQLNPPQRSLTVRSGGRGIGLLQYMETNPNDGYPWLGLLILDAETKGKGFGKEAYYAFEALIRQAGKRALRLGVIPGNEPAQRFWRAVGFELYDRKMSSIGIAVDCFEKKIVY